jgi:hypothetical protein
MVYCRNAGQIAHLRRGCGTADVALQILDSFLLYIYIEAPSFKTVSHSCSKGISPTPGDLDFLYTPVAHSAISDLYLSPHTALVPNLAVVPVDAFFSPALLLCSSDALSDETCRRGPSVGSLKRKN